MRETVADRIAERLLAVGMTPRSASLKAGLSADAIRNIQRAAALDPNHAPRGNTLKKLAPVLEASAQWLLIGANSSSSEVDAVCAVLKTQPPNLQKRALRVILALIEDEKENHRSGKNGTEEPEDDGAH